MKLHALCASAVELTLALSSPATAGGPGRSLDENTVGFVTVATTSAILMTKCGYEPTEGNKLRKAADSMGVDFERYGPAVFAAIMAISGGEYERDQLIPDVTVFKEYKVNQRKACERWSETPLSIGAIRK